MALIHRLKDAVQKAGARPAVRRAIQGINLAVFKMASLNRLTSIVYHFIDFFTFSREQHALAAARYHYYRNLVADRGSRVELRRNIHRIEKGLLMRPRKPRFALNFIQETVESYEKAAAFSQGHPDQVDTGELCWAHDVLARYFDTVETDPLTSRLKERFDRARPCLGRESSPEPGLTPCRRGEATPPPVSYDALLELSFRRRSVRWFLPEPVPRDLIDRALMVARQAPTACNRMPYRYRVYDDPDLVARIGRIPFGAAGFYRNIPTLIVLTGRLDFFFSARDRHVIYIDASLSAMAFMLALETLGLSSCVINWPDFELVELKLQKVLGLAMDERPVCLMAVGYPDPEGEVACSRKKSLDQIRSFNQA